MTFVLSGRPYFAEALHTEVLAAQRTLFENIPNMNRRRIVIAMQPVFSCQRAQRPAPTSPMAEVENSPNPLAHEAREVHCLAPQEPPYFIWQNQLWTAFYGLDRWDKRAGSLANHQAELSFFVLEGIVYRYASSVGVGCLCLRLHVQSKMSGEQNANSEDTSCSYV